MSEPWEKPGRAWEREWETWYFRKKIQIIWTTSLLKSARIKENQVLRRISNTLSTLKATKPPVMAGVKAQKVEKLQNIIVMLAFIGALRTVSKSRGKIIERNVKSVDFKNVILAENSQNCQYGVWFAVIFTGVNTH